MSAITEIIVKRAEPCHVDGIVRLLRQNAEHHHKGRPDIFQSGGIKFASSDVRRMLKDQSRPAFVAVPAEASTKDSPREVLGFALCEIKEIKKHGLLIKRTTLFVDDVCVDETLQGRGIGKRIFSHVQDFARKIGAADIDLNVWCFNKKAIAFYESLGFEYRAFRMEMNLR